MSVLKNRLLRKIFVPKKEEVIREKRKLHNEEIHNFYSSPNTIMANSNKEDKIGKAHSMNVMGNAYKIVVKRERFEELGTDRRTVLKLLLRKSVCVCGLDPPPSGQGSLMYSPEQGNDLSSSIKSK